MPEKKFFAAESKDGVLIIRFFPRVYLTGLVAEEVGDQLFKLVDEQGCRRLVLNFANVDSLTSLIIGKLVNLQKKIQAVGGRLALCEVTPVVLEILDLLRLTTMITNLPTEQQAVESMK